jgi:hypothetical protein
MSVKHIRHIAQYSKLSTRIQINIKSYIQLTGIDAKRNCRENNYQ